MEDFTMEFEDEIDDIPVLRDDMDANEHAEKIRYWENYKARMVEHLKRQIETVQMRCDSAIGYHKSLLSNYIHRIPHRVTATQESYKLECGTIVVTREHDSIKKPDKASEKGIIERLEKDGDVSLIKTEKSLNWATYKKELAIDNGKVINKTTGEIVDDVQIEHVDANLVMRFEDREDNKNGTVSDS